METAPSAVADGITAIDTVMAGERELNSVYLVSAAEPLLIETGPSADADRLAMALTEIGIGRLDLAHVVVTHIHMDHAGGVGDLLERFPRARVWVHEVGAKHLADPARLVASTARTYGEARMIRLFGGMLPAPADRILAIGDGDILDLGDRRLRALYTPGHASHHIAVVDEDSGAVCTGEAIGSYLPWAPVFRPALPPPEVDLEAAHASIARIRALRPSAVLTSHFGPVPDPTGALAIAEDRIDAWASDVRDVLEADPDADVDTITARLAKRARADFEQDAGTPIDEARYDVLGSIQMNAQGLARYWRIRGERERA